MKKEMTSINMASVVVNDPKYKEPITYYMDDKLKKSLDTKIIPSLQKKDKDCVIVIDGAEGSGKSTFALQIGKHVDNSLDLSRVVFDADNFRQAIFKAEKGQCVIYDEAFTGLSSRSSLSSVNRILVSLMMQMRQKNLFVIIVLPTFFLLDKYVALFRTRALIHVYENKGIRGYYRVYNRKLKKYLYLVGQKTYSYGRGLGKMKVFTRNKGRFYGVFALGDDECEKLYRKKKSKALGDTEKNPMTAGQVKYREQRDLFLFLLRKITGMTYQQIENMISEYDIEMSYVQVRNICVKFGDKEKEEDKKTRKLKKNEKIEDLDEELED